MMPRAEKRPASTCGWMFSIRTRRRPSLGLGVREVEEEGGLTAADLFSWGKLNRVDTCDDVLHHRPFESQRISPVSEVGGTYRRASGVTLACWRAVTQFCT